MFPTAPSTCGEEEEEQKERRRRRRKRRRRRRRRKRRRRKQSRNEGSDGKGTRTVCFRVKILDVAPMVAIATKYSPLQSMSASP